jgi:hypothetical protein
MITAKEALQLYSDALPTQVEKTLSLCDNFIATYARMGYRTVGVDSNASWGVKVKVIEKLKQEGFDAREEDGFIRISW